jgi:hypothetical protein
MISFRKVGEFEINGESFGDAVGIFDGKTADYLSGAFHQTVVAETVVDLDGVGRRRLLTVLYQESPELFDGIEKGLTLLLDEHAAQQDA